MTSARWERSAALLCILASFAGCAPAAQSEVGLPVPDLALYTAYVHPLFEGSCASLDCHGEPGRPLRLYSETGLRIRDDLRAAPGAPISATNTITAEELAANVSSIAAVDVDEEYVDDRFVLLKPLSDVGGGIHHFGGRIWAGPDDVAYRCVRSWLVNAIDAAACAEAAARDALPPP